MYKAQELKITGSDLEIPFSLFLKREGGGILRNGLYRRIGAGWRKLATCANIQTYEINIIECNGRNDTTDQARCLIEKLEQGRGYAFTVGVMIQYLIAAELGDIVDWLYGSTPLSSAAATTTPTPSFSSSSLTTNSSNNPLASAIKSASASRSLTVSSLLTNPDLAHFYRSICLAMDESSAWITLLKVRGVLSGEGVEKWVAQLKTNWERNRSGEPSHTVIRQFVDSDSVFASTDVNKFCALLISLDVPTVQEAAVKLSSWLEEQSKKESQKSETAFVAQQDLRTWLIKHEICEATEVDHLILQLRKAGVKSIETLRGFTREDLKECGFNTVQAIKTVYVLKK